MRSRIVPRARPKRCSAAHSTLWSARKADWIRDRVAHSRLKPLGALIGSRAIDPLLRFLGRRLATMVLVLRKRG